MRICQKNIEIPVAPGNRNLLEHLNKAIKFRLDKNIIPIRFVITNSNDKFYYSEVGLIEDFNDLCVEKPKSIFHFVPRSVERTEKFVTALLVPTGIGTEIGGHAGDATPVARLLAEISDTLITHPNVVNASDINEIPESSLYVEGSIITRLLMGTIGLQRVRSNRLLVVIDGNHEDVFINAAINSINAAKACYGLNCVKIIEMDSPVILNANYTESGSATGKITNFNSLCEILDLYRGDYDSVAISSVIEVQETVHKEYFDSNGNMVNPWGGVEAMLTHAISNIYNIPSAHSPMMENMELLNMDPGIVDPRIAAEAVSMTFLNCILKGLHRSPKLITDKESMKYPDIITVEDISCLVIPDGCIGLPTLAALEQGINVVAVKENKNLMKNDLSALPWAPGQFYLVENYWEAAGVMDALKAGILPESVRRPLRHVNTEFISSKNNMQKKQRQK